MGKKNLVVWALDPFDSQLRSDYAEQFESWLAKRSFTLRPAYVSSPAAAKKHAGRALAIEQTIEQYLKSLGIKNRKCTILQEKKGKGHPTKRIEEFARSIAAPFIALSSHGRAELPRLLLGSFAEKLLLKSARPILFLPKKSSRKKVMPDKILFATDFSRQSRKALHSLLSLAKAWNSEIIIYHALTLPNAIAAGMAMGEVVAVVPESYFTEQEQWARASGERWAKLAIKFGVAARFKMREDGTVFKVAKSIIETAKAEGAGLVASASTSRAALNFVLGSVASDLIRANAMPLWIYGPKCAPSLSQKSLRRKRVDSRALEHELWDESKR